MSAMEDRPLFHDEIDYLNIPTNLCVCPEVDCDKVSDIYYRPSRHQYAMQLSCVCTDPHTTWFVCTQCTEQRKMYRTLPLLVRHYNNVHISVKKKSNDTSFASPDSLASPLKRKHESPSQSSFDETALYRPMAMENPSSPTKTDMSNITEPDKYMTALSVF